MNAPDLPAIPEVTSSGGVASLALVVASTLVAAAGCLLAIGLGGWLFWKLIRVMGRIQVTRRQQLPPA